jgi:hypothetical protein
VLQATLQGRSCSRWLDSAASGNCERNAQTGNCGRLRRDGQAKHAIESGAGQSVASDPMGIRTRKQMGWRFWAFRRLIESTPRAWLPVVDAFRTLVTCPPPAVRAVFQQIQTAYSSVISAVDFRRPPAPTVSMGSLPEMPPTARRAGRSSAILVNAGRLLTINNANSQFSVSRSGCYARLWLVQNASVSAERDCVPLNGKPSTVC